MSDGDTVLWMDSDGNAHCPLNLPELDALQRATALELRQYFELDAHFWQRPPLAGDDGGAVDLLLRLILPTVPQTEITQRDVPSKVRFLIRWFALEP